MKANQRTTPARRLIGELLRQRVRVAAALLGAMITAVLGLLYPLLTAQAIDEIITGGTGVLWGMPRLTALLLMLLSAFLIRGAFGYLQEFVMANVSQTLALRLRTQVSAKLNRLPLHYFDTHPKGDILSRVSGDLEKVADTVQGSLSQMFSASVSMLGALGMMFYLHWGLALVVLVTVLASIPLVAWLAGKTERLQAAQQAALGAFNAGVEEMFTGNAVIKAYGLQGHMAGKEKELSRQLYRTGVRAQCITFLVNPLIQLLNHLGYVAVALGGAMLVLRGGMSIAYIPAFFQYTNKSSESIMNASYLVNSLQGAVAAAGRVYALLDEAEQEADAPIRSLPRPARGAVRFEHVRFAYTPDAPLMEDVCLSVAPGSRVAIVGPTGAGKTTLVNLLMRFYEVSGGKITIDGVDIRQLSRAELYQTVGMVLQDPWLFKGSVAENIAYGKPGATRTEIVQAARAARADHFIRTLPKGYDTVLDEETAAISAGQKQLLTIARALLADPRILILDEATSSVDTRTEAEIQQAMRQLMQERTSFVIAHRLSTILDADCIWVMRGGAIIESGTHGQLMRQGGFYSQLYNAQFGFADEKEGNE